MGRWAWGSAFSLLPDNDGAATTQTPLGVARVKKVAGSPRIKLYSVKRCSQEAEGAFLGLKGRRPTTPTSTEGAAVLGSQEAGRVAHWPCGGSKVRMCSRLSTRLTWGSILSLPSSQLRTLSSTPLGQFPHLFLSKGVGMRSYFPHKTVVWMLLSWVLFHILNQRYYCLLGMIYFSKFIHFKLMLPSNFQK